MRNRILIALFGVLVGIALAFPARYFAAEKQPHMRAAAEHLRAAENELNQAEHDKRGHREKALQLTRQAIQEVEEGIQADK